MQWSNLLFLNFSVAPEIIQQRLPHGMKVDTFNGMAYISVVPMTLQHFSVKGMPRVFKKKFLECNVRTYVTVNQEPGIYFFSLDANSLPEVLGARWLFNLNYRFRRMHFALHERTYIFSMVSILKGRIQTHLHAALGDLVEHPDLLLQFCTNRNKYFVYKQKRLFMGQVYHEPWTFNALKHYTINTHLIQHSQVPAQAFYSRGLKVKAGFLVPAIRPIVFFDGACGFCSRAIKALIAIDRNNFLYVAPIQGKTFKSLFASTTVPDRIMFYDERGFSEGAAALLQILHYLPWYFKGFKIINIVPKKLLNAIYDRIAKHRHFCERPKSLMQIDRVLE